MHRYQACLCDRLLEWRSVGSSIGAGTGLEPDGIPQRIRGGGGYNPTLFLYEHTPGGIGLSERIFVQRDLLLARALRLVEGCPCKFGCPACVGPSEASRKSIAIALMHRALGNVRALSVSAK